MDPKQSFSLSSYSVYFNSPILFYDPLSDTVRLYNYQGVKNSRNSSEFNANPVDIFKVIEASFNLQENQQNAFFFNVDNELQYDCSKMESYSQD